ncbi:MAG: hypothetical protein ACOYYS_20340 [Chloroflexota bacterium]
MLSSLANTPWLVGLTTFVLMLCDWLLTVAQEKERAGHYAAHYQSYPVDTIEGNPALQAAVQRQAIVNLKHLLPAALVGTLAAVVVPALHGALQHLVLGYLWGLFLLVGTQHLSNLIGYRVGRKGIHGKLFLHQRTALLTQAGRYLSTALFVSVLFVLSGSAFILGVAVAGFVSALRQFVWLKRVPKILADDAPPT